MSSTGPGNVCINGREAEEAERIAYDINRALRRGGHTDEVNLHFTFEGEVGVVVPSVKQLSPDALFYLVRYFRQSGWDQVTFQLTALGLLGRFRP